MFKINTWLYILASYVLIFIAFYITLSHIDTLSDKVQRQEIEISQLKYKNKQLIVDYTTEIDKLTKSEKARNALIKEIRQNIVGTKHEECANSVIDVNIINRLREHNKR